MIITCDGKIVLSAYSSVGSDGCFNLIVNTSESRMDHYTYDDPSAGVVTFYFPLDLDDEMSNDGYVTLTAETPEDLAILARFRFSSWSKYQLWMVFVSDVVLGVDVL